MKLLVAIDFSEVTTNILERVSKLVKLTSAKIWLVHIASPEPDFIGYEVGPITERDFIAKKLQAQHKQLQALSKEMEDQGFDITPLLIQGPTVETILEEAEKLDADMIVCGSHGHGTVFHILVGSISRGLLQKSTIPLLIVPAKK